MRHPLIAALVLASLSPLAGAATFQVSNTNASGPGSLRQAMLDANAHADTSSTIAFDSGLTGTITPQFLSSDLPVINVPRLQINGPTAGAVTVDLANLQRLTLGASVVQFTLRRLTLVNGAAIDGGCLSSPHGASLNIEQVRFFDCTALSNGSAQARGGAVFSSGNTTLNDVEMARNTADGDTLHGALGGALALHPTSAGRSLTIRRSTIYQNLAVSAAPGSVSVLGGAIDAWGDIALTIEDSEFTGNGSARVRNAPTDSHSGYVGGVRALIASATVRRTVFRLNTSSNGASALDLRASNSANPVMAIENSVFDRNHGNLSDVANNGAAIMLYQVSPRLRNNSFTGNKAGITGARASSLFYGGNIDTLTLSSNAFGASADGSPSCGIGGGVVATTGLAGGFNQFSDGSCGWIASLGTVEGDLGLTERWESGTRYAFAPQVGSPLVDAGAAGVSPSDWTLCAEDDLFGQLRPQDNDGDGQARCSVGALEAAGPQPAALFGDGFEGP